jgi:hypothetical protein
MGHKVGNLERGGRARESQAALSAPRNSGEQPGRSFEKDPVKLERGKAPEKAWGGEGWTPEEGEAQEGRGPCVRCNSRPRETDDHGEKSPGVGHSD